MYSLVGSTGFVGSNLAVSGEFDGLYHTKNIEKAYGTRPDVLVYAGVRAAKYLANQDAEADWKQVQTAVHNIEQIAPKKLVLISTVDVYAHPVDVDEDTVIDEEQLAPYGGNRYRLEKWVREYAPDALIVRLPGLYGKNIRKNFIFDMLTIVPTMLNEQKYNELGSGSELIAEAYQKQPNGFYQCSCKDAAGLQKLREEFWRVGFTALNFTDSRGIFQFYNLGFLAGHIEKALAAGLLSLNIATEPVQIADLYKYIYGREFSNEVAKAVPHYDYKTRHAALFQGENGYLFSKAEVMADIKKFVEGYQS